MKLLGEGHKFKREGAGRTAESKCQGEDPEQTRVGTETQLLLPGKAWRNPEQPFPLLFSHSRASRGCFVPKESKHLC